MATKRSKTDPVTVTETAATQATGSPSIQHLLAQASPDPMDPAYPQYEAYMEQQAVREQKVAEHSDRQAADSDVSAIQARGIKRLGSLQTEEEDTMTIQTAEAMRLYLGFNPDGDSKFGIPGAKRAATALRQLFILTAQNNPYADWMLIQVDQRNASINKQIDGYRNHFLKLLESMRAQGLNYHIIAARDPQVLSLGYHSPYGFMMTNTIAKFDYLVRVAKSANRRDLITGTESHDALQRIKRECRSLFEFAAKAQRVFMNKNMLGLTRTDYASKEPAHVQRIDAAKAIYGVVPSEIFIGQIGPRHTMRNERVSGKELAILRELDINQSQVAAIPVTVTTSGLVD